MDSAKKLNKDDRINPVLVSGKLVQLHQMKMCHHHLHLDDLLLGGLVPPVSHATDQVLETLEVHFFRSDFSTLFEEKIEKLRALKLSNTSLEIVFVFN